MCMGITECIMCMGITECINCKLTAAVVLPLCQVLGKHCQVLGRGLMVETPTIHHILRGDIPVISDNSEQVFLRDFIESKSGTAGGRLAR